MAKNSSPTVQSLLDADATCVRPHWPFLYSLEADGRLLRNVVSEPAAAPKEVPARARAVADKWPERRLVRGRPPPIPSVRQPGPRTASAGQDLAGIVTAWHDKASD